MFSLFFDGSCAPFNPGGHCAVGVIIKKNLNERVFSLSKYIGSGSGFSSNVAEFEALSHGLDYLLKEDLHKKPIIVYGDSTVVLNAMSQRRGSKGICRDASLRCLAKVFQFRDIWFKWIPREQNYEADALSRPIEARLLARANQITDADPYELAEKADILHDLWGCPLSRQYLKNHSVR